MPELFINAVLTARLSSFKESHAGFPVAHPSLTVAEASNTGLVRVQWRTGNEQAAQDLATMVGLPLPAVGFFDQRGSWLAARTGPDECLLASPLDEEDRLLQRLEQHDVVAMTASDGRLGLVVNGVHARDLLSKGTSVDLRLARFAPGSLSTTRFAGLPALVLCLDDHAFRLYLGAEYAGFICQWIVDAAAEFSGSGI